jgi:hypothetical protein
VKRSLSTRSSYDAVPATLATEASVSVPDSPPKRMPSAVDLPVPPVTGPHGSPRRVKEWIDDPSLAKAANAQVVVPLAGSNGSQVTWTEKSAGSGGGFLAASAAVTEESDTAQSAMNESRRTDRISRDIPTSPSR